MEAYSTDMERWVAAQLRSTPLDQLKKLHAYYQQRGGPGLALVETELATRNQSAKAA